MRKNVAGQRISAHLVSRTDGSDVTTGTTTVYVTVDGTQSAGAGTVTHSGQGSWTYEPTQAETNGDHIAFTFKNSTAVSALVNVYTAFPQTGDSFARLGAPAGASVAADVAAVKADTANALTRLPASLVSGRMDASVGAMANDVLTSTALASSAVAEIADAVWDEDLAGHVSSGSTGETLNGALQEADYVPALTSAGTAAAVWNAPTSGYGSAGSYGALVKTNLDAAVSTRSTLTTAQVNAEADAALADVGLTTTVTGRIDVAVSTRLASAGYTAPLDAAGVRSAVGLASANLDTQLSTIAGFIDTEVAAILTAVDTEVAAIKAKTDNLPASPAAVSDIPTVGAIADAVWDEPISGHLTAGSVGSALNAAGSAGDPWATTLPGAYGAGTAGNIIGNRIDAAISSRLATAGYTAPLDASGVRGAVGLASANLDTQLSGISGAVATVDGVTDAILDAVDTEVGAIKSVTDKLDTAMELDGSVYRFTVNALEQAPAGGGGGTTDWTSDERTAIRAILGIPTSGTTPTDPSSGILDTIRDAVDLVGTYVDTEVGAIKVVTDRLDTALELDGSVYRFTTNALEQAPSGGGGGTDWTADERTQIRAILGIAGSGTTPADPTVGIMDTIRDAVLAVKASTDNLPADPADASDIAASFSTVNSNLTSISSAVAVVDGEVGQILAAVDTEIAAIKAKTDLIPASPAAVGDIPTAIENADALLARDIGSGTGAGTTNERTVRAALRFVRNRWAVSGGSLTVYKEDDATVAWSGPVSTNPSAEPITGIDPA